MCSQNSATGFEDRVQNVLRVQNARSWAHKYAVGAHFRGCICLENFASVSVYAGVVWSGARFRGCAFSRVHRPHRRKPKYHPPPHPRVRWSLFRVDTPPPPARRWSLFRFNPYSGMHSSLFLFHFQLQFLARTAHACLVDMHDIFAASRGKNIIDTIC